MPKTTSQSTHDQGRLRHVVVSQPNLRQLFQAVARERQRTAWFRLKPQERLITVGLFIGGTTLTLSALAWAAALSYIQHQRVRMVKLAGIADEQVAQLTTVRDVADDVALQQMVDIRRDLATAQREQPA